MAGSDLDPERLQQFGEKWGVQALYADYQEMLEKEDLDNREHHHLVGT